MDTAAYVIFSIIILALIAVIIALARRPQQRVAMPDMKALEDKLLYALATRSSIKEIRDILDDIPRDVVQSIISSTNKRSGKLNELMAALEMTKYDRLFYLGSPIDFVGVKYDEGVDFIEVKSGKSRFSEDEKKLRDLIKAGKVNYVPLRVERIGIAEEVEIEE
ncbi:MAG: Holliday junction resolvase-like protein [Chloroflexota bacterium]|nr:Holliday junction resolvase-like protein [Chloroflexota bacterium]